MSKKYVVLFAKEVILNCKITFWGLISSAVVFLISFLLIWGYPFYSNNKVSKSDVDNEQEFISLLEYFNNLNSGILPPLVKPQWWVISHDANRINNALNSYLQRTTKEVPIIDRIEFKDWFYKKIDSNKERALNNSILTLWICLLSTGGVIIGRYLVIGVIKSYKWIIVTSNEDVK